MARHTRGLQRREFLRRGVLGSAAIWAAGVETARSSAGVRSANEKLDIGCIGVGGKGWTDLHGVASENIVALCDVDRTNLARAGDAFPRARRFVDYRKMLDEVRLDAVTVSTPDHHHAPAGLRAMRLGRHVYCQKPLAHTVHEARRMREVAGEMKVATQMGNQGHSHSGSRRMVEWVRAGAIGEVREVHVWTDRPIWPQGHSRPRGRLPVPRSLEWDLWQGPAPERPYQEGYHPFKWRGFWDFGTGALGDMACHNMDAAYWALELGAPSSVQARSSGVGEETAPRWSIVRYEFPARGERPPVTLTWYDGGKRPPAVLAAGEKPGSNGSIWVGSSGTLVVPHYWGPGKLLPEARRREFVEPEPWLPRLEGDEAAHYREWILACKGGAPALSSFEYAGPLTETVLLGNVALRAARRIRWNAEEMRAEDCGEAGRFLRKNYREGWSI